MVSRLPSVHLALAARATGWVFVALALCARAASAEGDDVDQEGAARPVPKRTVVAEGPQKEATPAEEKPRRSYLYLDGETGIQYLGLESLHVKRDVVPSTVRRTDAGPFVGVGAGAKLVFLTVGPRFRLGHFKDWDLWTLDLEIGWRAPLEKVEPYLTLAGGYGRLGRAFDAELGPSNSVIVDGYDVRAGIGADYFMTHFVSLGANVTGDLLGMYRPGVNMNSQDGLINDALKFDGASAGLGVTGAVVLGLHP